MPPSLLAPSSTKNEDNARDPEMHQTKKDNQWHFGMKVHIGVDSKTAARLYFSSPALHSPSPSTQFPP